jgi:tRNA-modifying protein YgfZ
MSADSNLTTPTARSGPPAPGSRTPRLDGAAALGHWGVIQAQGPEAAHFLHQQLTQDLLLLQAPGARLAAYCSAKGRMLASMVAIKPDADTVLLLLPREVLPATLKRLSMFVLRAKVKLTDATAAFRLLGCVGNAVPAALAGDGVATWTASHTGGALAVRLPGSLGHERALLCLPAQEAGPAASLPASTWDWLEVRSGVVHIGAALADALVPQMLNYESVGGVNFKKGCYPGQEVVARSQFRGTLKRRAFVAHSSAALTTGQEVFHSSDAEQPCGVVVAVGTGPEGADGGCDAVVSLQLSAAQAEGSLHAGSAQASAPRLQLLALPYALLEDI